MMKKWQRQIDGTYKRNGYFVTKKLVIINHRWRVMWALYKFTKDFTRADGEWCALTHYGTLRDAKAAADVDLDMVP